MNKIKITFIDSDDSLIDKIEEYFIKKEELGITIIGKYNTKGEFFENKKISLETDVFIVSANLPDGTGIEIIEFLKGNETLSKKPIFLMIDKQTMNYARLGKEKGVDEILQKPYKMGILLEALAKHTSFEIPSTKKPEPTRENRKSKRIFDEIESSEDLNTKGMKKKSSKKGVFTFVSTSSSGKTTLIVNLANILRNLENEKPSVCILDLNLILPAAIYMFNQEDLTKPKRDIYDITKDLNYLNQELILEAMFINNENGIHLLSAPTNPESMHKVNSIKAPQIEKLIVLLREMYDIVLIDTPNFPTDDVVLTPVQYSDKNILIIEPNFINIVSASKIFYIFETLEQNIKENIKDKTFIVLNRDKKKSSINNETTRMFLEGKKLVVRLPEDPEYISLINKGTLISESNSEMIGPIKKLSQFMFDHQEEIKKKKKSLLTGLFNKKK